MTTMGSDGVRSKAERLIEAVRVQERLFERLERVSAERGVDGEDLVRIVCEREGIVDALGRLAETLGPLIEQAGVLEEGMSDAERSELDARLTRTRGLMERVAAHDREILADLERARGEVGRALGGVARNRRALSGYGGPVRHGPQFQDREV